MTMPPAELRSARSEGKCPSARGADLYGADLRGADLRGADLYGADLHEADLRGANLHEADLRGADLYGADLRGADLYGADLHEADLYGADLYGANLHEADLRGANLRGADLYGANLRGANLRGADWDGLRIDGLPSGQVTLIPTPHGWALSYGCWLGAVAGLRDIIDGEVPPPEARGEEIERRRPGWIAVAALCDAHIAAHPGVIEALAEKWGADS